MGQLNDTMVQGDLRVTGKIYGTDNTIHLENANLAIPPLGAGDYVGSTGDFFIPSGSGKNLPITTNNFNIHTTVTRLTGTTYRLSQIATPTASNNPGGIYERSGISSDGVTWTFGSWVSAILSSQKGAANGVGSLGSNSVQPYSEMYKGYAVEGDSVFKLCRILKTTTYSGGVSFAFVSRAYNKASGQTLLWVSPCEYEDSSVNYKVVNMFSRANDNTMQFFYKEVTVNSTSYVDVYFRVYGSSQTHVIPLWMRNGVQDMLSTSSVSLPDGAVEMTSRFFNVCAAKAGVGSGSTPVFVNNAGNVQACTSLTPIPLSYSAASATKGYKIATVENSDGGDPMYAGCMIAVCLRENTGADCQIILSVSFSEYSNGANVGPVSGKAFTLHNRITTIGAIRFFVNKVSASKYDIYAYTNGSNNYLSCQCISGKGVTIHSSPSPETITIGNMTELARSRAVVAQSSGQIGSSTRPVYVDSSGVVQPCSEAGYIEIVDGPLPVYTPGVCYLI